MTRQAIQSQSIHHHVLFLFLFLKLITSYAISSTHEHLSCISSHRSCFQTFRQSHGCSHLRKKWNDEIVPLLSPLHSLPSSPSLPSSSLLSSLKVKTDHEIEAAITTTTTTTITESKTNVPVSSIHLKLEHLFLIPLLSSSSLCCCFYLMVCLR